MSRPYRECPYCGAHLDPGERCDCRDREVKDRPGEERGGPRHEDDTRKSNGNRGNSGGTKSTLV